MLYNDDDVKNVIEVNDDIFSSSIISFVMG
jgi:hypothetical protein